MYGKHVSKYRHLEKTVEKHCEWKWLEEHTKAFNKLKEGFIKRPCLAHYNAESENIITTYATSKSLEATLGLKS